jgi:hypothetical protein
MLSPRKIVRQENLDCKRHCNAGSWWAKIYKHECTKIIGLHPPSTNGQCSGRSWIVASADESGWQTTQTCQDSHAPNAIKQMHALAVLDDMPLGLKITNRANNVTFNTAWIAGVDHDEEEFEDEN